MNNQIQYKGELIAKNSEAYRLWEAKKMNELDIHLARLTKEAIKRGEIRVDPSSQTSVQSDKQLSTESK